MQFRVGTWNCFGMGQGAYDAITKLRAPAPTRFHHEDVHAACVTPDILCVQELLSRDAESFFDGLGTTTFGSRFRDHNRTHWRSATFRGSGLGIASRAPLLRPGVRHYRPPQVGWDKLARKGTLHTQVELDRGPTFDLLNTHLQAGYDEGAVAVRAAQLDELATLVREIADDDRPFIVCGDFNINGLEALRDSDAYRRLLSALEGFEDLGAKRDLATFEPHPETNSLAHAFDPGAPTQRIDYVFFRPAPRARHRFAPGSLERILDRPLTPRAGTDDRAAKAPLAFASDHFGLCATFEYEVS